MARIVFERFTARALHFTAPPDVGSPTKDAERAGVAITVNLDIIVSDPWEFGTEHGVGPFECKLLNMSEDGRSAYAQLLKPLVIHGESCGFVAIEARWVKPTLQALFDGTDVPANFDFCKRVEDADSPSAAAVYGGIGDVSLHRL